MRKICLNFSHPFSPETRAYVTELGYEIKEHRVHIDQMATAFFEVKKLADKLEELYHLSDNTTILMTLPGTTIAGVLLNIFLSGYTGRTPDILHVLFDDDKGWVPNTTLPVINTTRAKGQARACRV